MERDPLARGSPYSLARAEGAFQVPGGQLCKSAVCDLRAPEPYGQKSGCSFGSGQPLVANHRRYRGPVPVARHALT